MSHFANRRVLGLVLAAGLIFTGLPFASGSGTALAQSATAQPATPDLWSVAATGSEAEFNTALERAETSAAAPASLRESFAALDAAVAKREASRAEKLAEVDAKLDKKLAETGPEALSEAIKLAVERWYVSLDRAAFLHEPRIAELIRRGEAAAKQAETAGDWFTANELYYRLHTLLEDEGIYKADVKRLGLRLSMIRLYAPEQFWKLRNDERIKADKSPLPPYNGLGEDYNDKLAGIDKGMVFRAVAAATRQQIDRVPMREMMLGGLDALRTMITTSDLANVFDGLKNPAAKDAMLAALNQWTNQITAPDALVTNQTLLDCLDSLVAANRTTVALPDNSILHEFGNGAMGRLDDFSAIIWPDEVSRFNRMTEGRFRGVGIQIQMDDETQMIKVVTPLEGTPAMRAGIKSGDLIKKIDGNSAIGITLNQAVDLITGPENTKVNITVERAVENPPEGEEDATVDVDYQLVRALIPTPSVKGWSRLGAKEDQWDWFIDRGNRIGYIRLLQFTDDTTRSLRSAIKQMQNEGGGLNGLILDLRYNPGGLLTEAVSVSNVFIDKGTIVSTEGTMMDEPKAAIPGQSLLGKTPLVVLINEGSASASEIVSGAIRHYADRGDIDALIVGQRSFGKGSVQNVWNLSQNSKMKLTTQYYKLPDGRILHKKPGASTWGVDPHLRVTMLPEQESDALKLRQEADVLPIDAEGNIVEADTPRPDPRNLVEEGIDLQLQTALVLLQSKAVDPVDTARLPQ